MKKTFFVATLLVAIFFVFMTSCKKDKCMMTPTPVTVGTVLDITRANTDQNAHTVTVNLTGAPTSKVQLLQFNVSSQNGSSISINSIPVIFTPAGAAVSQLTDEVYLMNGSTVLDAESVFASNATVTDAPIAIVFKNFSNPGLIVTGSTTTLTVVADINSIAGGGYSEGASLTVSTPIGNTAFNLTAGTPIGNELVDSSDAKSVINGTANGQPVAFYSGGITVVETSDVCVSANGNTSSSMTCNITFTVTANNTPAYIPATAVLGISPNTSGITFSVVNSSGTEVPNNGIPSLKVSATVSQSGINAIQADNGTSWLINAGNTATFNATISLVDNGNLAPGTYHAYLTAVNYNAAPGGAPWITPYTYNLGASNPQVPGFVVVQ